MKKNYATLVKITSYAITIIVIALILIVALSEAAATPQQSRLTVRKKINKTRLTSQTNCKPISPLLLILIILLNATILSAAHIG